MKNYTKLSNDKEFLIHLKKEIKSGLSDDKEFLKFIKKEIKSGYKLEINLKEMQKLIYEIASWYKFKYPDDYIRGELDNYVDFTDKMTIEQLLLRLTYIENKILKCEYSSNDWIYKKIYNGSESIENKQILFFQLKNSFNHTILKYFDPITGLIYDYITSQDNTKEINKTNRIKITSIEDLYNFLTNKKDNKLNFEELKKIIKKKKVDEEIRKYILKKINKATSQDNIFRSCQFEIEIDKYLKNRNSYIIGNEEKLKLFNNEIEIFCNTNNKKILNKTTKLTEYN